VSTKDGDMSLKLVKEKTLPLILSALKEDVDPGDVTSSALFDKDAVITACIVAKEDCILAGIDAARWVFNALDEKMNFLPLCQDGGAVKKGKRVLSVKGSMKGVLAGERTALNILGRLSGAATLTAKFVKAVKGTKAKIFDTRKTTPGMRDLEKYAVKLGGGHNHRMGLWDGILIKDNHLDILRGGCKGDKLKAINNAIAAARGKGYKNIEIEVNDISEFKEALESGADIIMLDNMDLDDIKKAVKIGKAASNPPALEVSGGVTLENVHGIAKTGIDRISIGCLTHSAPSIDFSLDIY